MSTLGYGRVKEQDGPSGWNKWNQMIRFADNPGKGWVFIWDGRKRYKRFLTWTELKNDYPDAEDEHPKPYKKTYGAGNGKASAEPKNKLKDSFLNRRMSHFSMCFTMGDSLGRRICCPFRIRNAAVRCDISHHERIPNASAFPRIWNGTIMIPNWSNPIYPEIES